MLFVIATDAAADNRITGYADTDTFTVVSLEEGAAVYSKKVRLRSNGKISFFNACCPAGVVCTSCPPEDEEMLRSSGVNMIISETTGIDEFLNKASEGNYTVAEAPGAAEKVRKHLQQKRYIRVYELAKIYRTKSSNIIAMLEQAGVTGKTSPQKIVKREEVQVAEPFLRQLEKQPRIGKDDLADKQTNDGTDTPKNDDGSQAAE